MLKIKNKNTGSELKKANDKFNMEAGKEIGVHWLNDDFPTKKIIYGYELGLKNKL